jgi:hypothetical protein
MSSERDSRRLLNELDNQHIGVRLDGENEGVPTLSCDSDEHNNEPIREGENMVVFLVRQEPGVWSVVNTFCSRCSALDSYTALDDGQTTAVVEGVMTPGSDFGDADVAYILDAFLWELNEATHETV